MKIVVNEIPRNGLFLEEKKTAKELDLERGDFEFEAPVSIRVDVDRNPTSVHIRMEITSGMSFQCGRCLKRIAQPIERKIDFIKSADEEKIIDLTQIAREEIILDYPVKLICSPDCKGICPECGMELNRRSCSCAKTSTLRNPGLKI